MRTKVRAEEGQEDGRWERPPEKAEHHTCGVDSPKILPGSGQSKGRAGGQLTPQEHRECGLLLHPPNTPRPGSSKEAV